MKQLSFFLFFLSFSAIALCQNYQFDGSISRGVLDNYLDRAITMQGQSNVDGIGGLPLNATERQKNIDMIGAVGAKFIHRICGWWINTASDNQVYLPDLLARCEENVTACKAIDGDIICQAAIFETADLPINDYAIPKYVFQAFGIPFVNRNFNYQDMLYPDPHTLFPDQPDFEYLVYGGVPMDANMLSMTPDICQLETQMWFYYLATKYINAGCEALHFGQAEIMNRRDVGNCCWWSLLQKVRSYAATYATRHVVICDAHTTTGMYYEPELCDTSIVEWQRWQHTYKWNAQLLWDFHSLGVGLQEDYSRPCVSPYGFSGTPNEQPVTLPYNPNEWLHRRSFGGLNPQGWSCRENPYLVELDNGSGHDPLVGCNFDNQSAPWWLWGWDEITWFRQQKSSPPTYNLRNELLKYIHYKIKCLDPNGHFAMPGMRSTTYGLYRANTGYFYQQQTIKDIWSGVYSSPNAWVKRNFTDEIAVNLPDPVFPKSNLIFVGNNRMYYIGNDNRVHGYVKVNGAWLTTSPSFAAGNVGNQVEAAGDLIANPSGTYLYYRGTNGLVYRYQIVDDWTYIYSEMPTNAAMIQQHLVAVGPMICTADNRIYYIASETGGTQNAQRIHGFIKVGSNWLTVSPTWAPGNVPGYGQVQPAGDLIANPSGTYLYYRGMDGYIYRQQILSDWSYLYSPMPTNSAMQSQNITAIGSLICPADNRIYYIAREANNNNAQWIHGFCKTPSGNWFTVSPSWSANASGQPGQSINEQRQAVLTSLSASPNNLYLAYIGDDKQLHRFNILSNTQYEYFNFKTLAATQLPNDATIFNPANELFYISQNIDSKIYQFSFGPDNCENAAVQNTEPNCCDFMTQNTPDISDKIESGQDFYKIESRGGNDSSEADPQIVISPNPAKDVLAVQSTDVSFRIVGIQIIGADGRKYFQQAFDHTESATLSLGNYPPGLYFVAVSGDASAVTKKIMIETD